MTKVGVIGLGYVGAVAAACMASAGADVIGVDISPKKVADINAGHAPFFEPGLAGLIQAAVESGRLTATTNLAEAIEFASILLICVGTPPLPTGAADLSYLEGVSRDIGNAIRKRDSEYVVVIRSTVPPGGLSLCREIVTREAGRGDGLHFAFYPEFLREGSAVADFSSPPYSIIGAYDNFAFDAVARLCDLISAPVVRTEVGVAELLKSVSNAWHATKITFANEIGRLSGEYGIDGSEVMGLIARDSKLNVSSAYLAPGFAYGGSCLPKDVASLNFLAGTRSIDLPLIESLRASNAVQIEMALGRILSRRPRSVGVVGLAFKAGTDDLRESPSVAVVKRLLGEGCKVSVYDPALIDGDLIGSNLRYVRDQLPHFEQLLVPDAELAINGHDVVVICHKTLSEDARIALTTTEAHVVDLVYALSESGDGVQVT